MCPTKGCGPQSLAAALSCALELLGILGMGMWSSMLEIDFTTVLGGNWIPES